MPNYHSPSEWIVLIEQAGLADHAALGRQLLASGKVIMVSPPTLDESYNAYTWIADREIWINRPLFSRYPDIKDQAEIFLHELIHISSQEITHSGSWWSDLQVYRTYWESH